MVFFSEVTAEAVRSWLEVHLEWDIGGDWVFLSHHGGGQLTVYSVNQLLTRLKERGGAEGRCPGPRTRPHTPSHISARIRDSVPYERRGSAHGAPPRCRI